MHTLSWALLIGGGVLSLLGSLWIIVLGWQRSIWWGVLCLIFPIAQLIYVATHWKESKEAFLMLAGGFVLMILATVAAAPGQ
jgi:hypothetical protein